MTHTYSRFVLVDGIRTHYLDAGDGPPLILLHSGEFGASAQFSWEHNIEALARHYRVVAPDWLGYGETEKVFSFEDMWAFRIRHITSFLRTLCIGKAHYMGNSMGGTMLLGEAALHSPPWEMDKIVVVSGGGHIPENGMRTLLNSYDGSREHMKRILETLVRCPVAHDDAYIDRRVEMSRELGAWECTAAPRFKAPWREQRVGMPKPPDYSGVKVPVLLVVGSSDPLREPGFGQQLQAQVPGSRLHVIEGAGHVPHIDNVEEFNREVLAFLGQAD